MLKVDEFLLFTFDLSVLDEEGDRWVVHEPTTEPPPESDRTKVCACRRHPSGSEPNLHDLQRHRPAWQFRGLQHRL
jgi:hypothetical protein